MCIQETIRDLHLMNHIISSSCNPENEKISDLCNIFSKNFHICNEGVLLMDQQIQQSRGIRKIFFLVLRKMQKDNIEADRRKHDHKWHIRFR